MRNFIRDIKHKIRAHIDASAERKLFAAPDLAECGSEYREIEQAMQEAAIFLAPHYKEYKAKVSTGGSAASLELSALIYACCTVIQARRVVDLGSGFTSFVLRQFQAQSQAPVEAWSVDDNTDWLAATGEYLLKNGLSDRNLLLWDDFAGSLEAIAPLDLIVLDVRPIERRIEWLPRLLQSLSPHGIIVADDMHKPHMRRPTLRVAKDVGAACVDCSRLTKDSYGRYAAVLFPPRKE